MATPERPVMATATRRLPLDFDDDGNPIYHTMCSPVTFKARGLAVIPPKHVIPVIFVPGIMGSNLRATLSADPDQGDTWAPPNSKLEGLSEWLYRLFQSNAKRQKQLTPSRCEVSPGGHVSIPHGHYTLTEKEAKRRGWGEVHWDSYGQVLLELERVLNDQYDNCGTTKSLLDASLVQRADQGRHREVAATQEWRPWWRRALERRRDLAPR